MRLFKIVVMGTELKKKKLISQLYKRVMFKRKRKITPIESNGCITDKNGSITDKNGCITDKNGSITDKNGCITDKNGIITDKNGSIIDKKRLFESTATFTQAIGVAQAENKRDKYFCYKVTAMPFYI